MIKEVRTGQAGFSGGQVHNQPVKISEPLLSDASVWEGVTTGTRTRTPVVARISHDHQRAQRCAKCPWPPSSVDPSDSVPNTIV